MKPEFSAKTRTAVHAMTGGRCFYCGLQFPEDPARDWLIPQKRLGIDHKIPRDRGGGDDLGNLLPSCDRCNSKKATATIKEYRFRLALSARRMPFRFACEPQIATRDFIVVASPDFAQSLIAHNCRDAPARKPRFPG